MRTSERARNGLGDSAIKTIKKERAGACLGVACAGHDPTNGSEQEVFEISQV